MLLDQIHRVQGSWLRRRDVTGLRSVFILSVSRRPESHAPDRPGRQQDRHMTSSLRRSVTWFLFQCALYSVMPSRRLLYWSLEIKDRAVV